MHTSRVKLWMGLVIAAVLAGYYVYVEIIVPAPFYILYDPELQYMSSSLAIFKGQPYVYIDHPGTPVELVGSGLLALTYPIVSINHQSFTLFHIQHPELFLFLARGLLTLTSIGVALLLLNYAMSGNTLFDVIAALGVSISFFSVYLLSFSTLVRWGHNYFSFPVGT